MCLISKYFNIEFWYQITVLFGFLFSRKFQFAQIFCHCHKVSCIVTIMYKGCNLTDRKLQSPLYMRNSDHAYIWINIGKSRFNYIMVSSFLFNIYIFLYFRFIFIFFNTIYSISRNFSENQILALLARWSLSYH